jgi:hypothetical protein
MPTLIAGYANQSVGYVPPEPEWDLLGYEVGAAYLGRGAAEIMLGTCAELF